MSFCNVPRHVHNKEFWDFLHTKNPKVRLYDLPRWTKDKYGRGPYSLVVQVYDWNRNLTLEVEARPCKGCWRKIIYWAVGLRRKKIEAEYPEFSAYLGWEPAYTPQDDVIRVAGGKYKEIRRMVAICLDELMKRHGKKLRLIEE